MKKAKNRLIEKWFVCRVTSGRKSAQYGIRFSYPFVANVSEKLTTLDRLWMWPGHVDATGKRRNRGRVMDS